MLDDFKEEQAIMYKLLCNSVNKNKASHAYLLEFNGYQRGFDFALALAKYLLCPNKYTNNELCGNCTQCSAIDSDNFIELKIIEPDGQWIKKEQLEELQKEFSKKALIGNKKIYIIRGAEKLNNASANSILKFLEEPLEGIIAILTTENIHQVLGTIKSRCQILSLVRTKNSETNRNTKQILSNITYTTKEEIENFNSNEESDDKIIALIEYINYVERNKNKAIIYKNKPLLEVFSDKKQLEIAFSWMILYYKDVLNVKLNKNLECFFDYEEYIKDIALNNTLISICKKIEILVELSEKIKFNVNNNMLMDKLVIKLSEV